MSLQFQVQLSVYLLIAAFLSAVIGLDREKRHAKSAGVRTHMMVGIGSCLFTILSIYAFPGSDSGRVAAQIVSGIGFLGAGVIILRDRNVKNLTTAASIWVTAAIGMAVGAGAWYLASVATLIVWMVLAYLRRWTKHPEPGKHKALKSDTKISGEGQATPD